MTTDSVAVIDYGMGNLHSVASALQQVGAGQVEVTHDAARIARADRVIFPGVGAMRDCMGEIRRLHCDRLLLDTLRERHRPVLAICVGMQALLTRSEENGGVDCLDIVAGEVRLFRGAGATEGSPEGRQQRQGEAPLTTLPGSDNSSLSHIDEPAQPPAQLKVPHIGWNRVSQPRPHPLWRGIDSGERFYFVHSYYARVADRALVSGSTHYGLDFDAALARDNLFAVQFHPEKSHRAGLHLLRNFLHWNGRDDG